MKPELVEFDCFHDFDLELDLAFEDIHDLELDLPTSRIEPITITGIVAAAKIAARPIIE